MSDDWPSIEKLSIKPNISHVLKTLSARPQAAGTEFADTFEIAQPLASTITDLQACIRTLSETFLQAGDTSFGAKHKNRLQFFPQLAVVGQMKSGKSSFINGIAGRSDFLPTHVNPWTAVPTALYFGMLGKPAYGADFEFFDEDEWDSLGDGGSGLFSVGGEDNPSEDAELARSIWMRALLRLGDQYPKLLGKTHSYKRITRDVLDHYLCAGPPISERSRNAQPGRYADITRMARIYLPMAPFAWPSVVIDTPGLNDPSFIRLKTTQSALEDADVYVVVLTALQPLSIADISLLQLLRGLDKRRFLVFINRIDELQGHADVRAVVDYVKNRLTHEFPDTEISLCLGSAQWAAIANSGTDAEVEEVTQSPLFAAHAETETAKLNDPSFGADGRRQLLFSKSGFPEVAAHLSELMVSSFMRAEGGRLTKEIADIAGVAAANARNELDVIANLSRKPATPTGGFDASIAIRQIEERLSKVTNLQNETGDILQSFKKEQDNTIENTKKFIYEKAETLIYDFVNQHSDRIVFDSDLQTRSAQLSAVHGLINEIESFFFGTFQSSSQELSNIEQKYILKLQSYLDIDDVDDKKHPQDLKSLNHDIKDVLPALSRIGIVDLEQPWWQFWKTQQSPEKLADQAAQNLLEKFSEVPADMSGISERKLVAQAEAGRRTLEVLTSDISNATIGQLEKLRAAIFQYQNQNDTDETPQIESQYLAQAEVLQKRLQMFKDIIARLKNIAHPGR